jgi:hypothetical protein
LTALFTNTTWSEPVITHISSDLTRPRIEYEVKGFTYRSDRYFKGRFHTEVVLFTFILTIHVEGHLRVLHVGCTNSSGLVRPPLRPILNAHQSQDIFRPILYVFVKAIMV